MGADFNTNNKQAMMRSEVLSWPLTMVLLVIAFGTLVAAGLPVLLTMVGLASAAGVLFLGAQFMDISIWAMNFAMMFAIALGIDYALFVVVRFREALAGGAGAREATGVAMETAGKAVFTSGLAVFAALMAVALVPSPTFQTVPLGIALSVCFVLAASLTLLPAVLSKLGPRVNRLPIPRLAHRARHPPQPRRRLRALGRARLAPPPRLRGGRGRRPRPARGPGTRASYRDAVDPRRPKGRELAARLRARPASVRAWIRRTAAGRYPPVGAACCRSRLASRS